MIIGGFTGNFPYQHRSVSTTSLTGVIKSAPMDQLSSPKSLGTMDRAETFRKLKTDKPTVRWVGPLFDGSGYAEASRNYVAALSVAGVVVTGISVSFEEARSDYGAAGRYAKDAVACQVPYAINIIHLTPENYEKYKVNGCYNIGLFAWETDVLPNEWVKYCNLMDEIWVPCKWTADVARTSGINRPIRVFGHCANLEEYADGPALSFPEISTKWFKFYSIFQWTERKNPRGLLKAYLSEFRSDEKVVLVLKTYRSNYSTSEQNAIISEINDIKRKVGGRNQPRILVILDMMTREEILALHRMGDCFVLIHRAEGWGLPIFEACLMGRPVITTGYGGNMEFTRPEMSYLVGYQPTQVRGMDWIRWYQPHMNWTEPNIEHCRRLMRHVFENRREAMKRAIAARKFAAENFSWQRIGSAMRKRIEEILS